jgi:hypothetical protein
VGINFSLLDGLLRQFPKPRDSQNVEQFNIAMSEGRFFSLPMHWSFDMKCCTIGPPSLHTQCPHCRGPTGNYEDKPSVSKAL